LPDPDRPCLKPNTGPESAFSIGKIEWRHRFLEKDASGNRLVIGNADEDHETGTANASKAVTLTPDRLFRA